MFISVQVQFEHSAMRCKSGVTCHNQNTTNKTVSAEHINLSIGSAWHKVLCFANKVITAHTAAFCRLHIFQFTDIFVGETMAINNEKINKDGKRY